MLRDGGKLRLQERFLRTEHGGRRRPVEAGERGRSRWSAPTRGEWNVVPGTVACPHRTGRDSSGRVAGLYNFPKTGVEPMNAVMTEPALDRMVFRKTNAS